jgi:hypothetical protein
MYSRVMQLEELKQRSVMYWLPPGGRDNGVWADTWVILAELEAGDATAVLDLLAEADIGGYVAIPAGQKARANGCHHLYVDMMQYQRAVDVLMLFLRGKGSHSDGAGTAAKGPSTRNSIEVSRWCVIAAVIRQLTMKEALRKVIWVLIAAALIALALTFVYYAGSARFPAVHPSPHHVPAATP